MGSNEVKAKRRKEICFWVWKEEEYHLSVFYLMPTEAMRHVETEMTLFFFGFISFGLFHH